MVSTFKDLFQQRFPSKFAALPSKSLNQQLSELHQQADETIDVYYKQTCALILCIGTKDRVGDEKLSLLEISRLDNVLKALIKSLLDDNIWRDIIQGLGTAGRSFRGVSNLALEAEQTRRKLLELLDENFHSREFQLYKDLVHRNMDHDKIEALLLSCKTDSLPPK